MSARADDRKIFRFTGSDRAEFLQGLVTNDVGRLHDGLVYAALLTPQGKYLADFFLVPADDAILLDVHADLAPALLKRLMMYKLRSDVQITPLDIPVHRGTTDAPESAFADPRHEALGWRAYGATDGVGAHPDWDALRVRHLVPESGIELIPDDSFILETEFERLNGVDFRKGCYVGQEVTARMKHKTQLRKGLARVSVGGIVPVGTPILAGEKPAGTIFTQSDGEAIAYLRFDRAAGDMTAGGQTVRRIDPES